MKAQLGKDLLPSSLVWFWQATLRAVGRRSPSVPCLRAERERKSEWEPTRQRDRKQALARWNSQAFVAQSWTLYTIISAVSCSLHASHSIQPTQGKGLHRRWETLKVILECCLPRYLLICVVQEKLDERYYFMGSSIFWSSVSMNYFI